MGIPRFNGKDVKGWIQLCNQFFLFHSTHDERRVMFVAMHADGLVRLWSESKFHSLEGLTWIKFRDALNSRFSDQGHENVIAELNHLRR